jgi:hypothetical protein
MTLHHITFVGTSACMMYYHTQFNVVCVCFSFFLFFSYSSFSSPQWFISYKQQTMLSIAPTQQSCSILHCTANYLTRSHIMFEDLSPYKILRSCPIALAVALVMCSHLPSFHGHYVGITDNTQWTMFKGEVDLTGIMFIPSDTQFFNWL